MITSYVGNRSAVPSGDFDCDAQASRLKPLLQGMLQIAG
jgi:hypothetical protein